MSIEEKISLLEDMMDLDEGALNEGMQLDDIEEWDSLSALSLIVYAKNTLGKNLTSDVLATLQTVKDICDYLS